MTQERERGKLSYDTAANQYTFTGYLHCNWHFIQAIKSVCVCVHAYTCVYILLLAVVANSLNKVIQQMVELCQCQKKRTTINNLWNERAKHSACMRMNVLVQVHFILLVETQCTHILIGFNMCTHPLTHTVA